MKPTLFAVLITLSIFFGSISTLAFETDQYNLPPVPLADIGDEVSGYVEGHLMGAVARVNSEIDKNVNCLETKTTGCRSSESHRQRLIYLRSNDAIAHAFFAAVGDGNVFTTKFGNWMREHKFRSQPDRYKTTLAESIFVLNLADYLTLGATVRLFGAEFGIDKLEHIFQQGYKYYQIERAALVRCESPNEAVKKAVKWGQRTERTYYGILASGVYSNADLYANYVGMRFYQGFTRPLQINGKMRPAIVHLNKGSWNIDPAAIRLTFLKPFLTDHLNEAFNPSAFRFTLVRSVRRAVKKYGCPDWRQAYPDLTQMAMATHSKSLEMWNGEDYGHTKRSRIVRLSELCFDNKDNQTHRQ